MPFYTSKKSLSYLEEIQYNLSAFIPKHFSGLFHLSVGTEEVLF